MLRAEFLDNLRYRVAEIAIGPSSLRKQGAPGVIKKARSFLKSLDLRSFVGLDEVGFCSRLDKETASLQDILPENGRHWGAARKALNLFLRDALYCSDLSVHYGLQAIRQCLEVPLDRQVALGLRRYPELTRGLPRWTGIKHLTPDVSARYQDAASAVGRKEGLPRVDLDVIFYRAATLLPEAVSH